MPLMPPREGDELRHEADKRRESTMMPLTLPAAAVRVFYGLQRPPFCTHTMGKKPFRLAAAAATMAMMILLHAFIIFATLLVAKWPAIYFCQFPKMACLDFKRYYMLYAMRERRRRAAEIPAKNSREPRTFDAASRDALAISKRFSSIARH